MLKTQKKILIITQKVDIDDGVLGFFHRWIEEFSKYCEKVTVICLFEGEHNLPKNVKVLSLGKDKGGSKASYLLNFYKYIWSERKNYDSVFVHMNPQYILLGGVFWKLWQKKIGLWYTHKNVDLQLKIAEKITDYIFTASEKSFRFKSNKTRILGHGIDINQFNHQKSRNKDTWRINILNIGRISKIKNIHILIDVCESLLRLNKDIIFKVVGMPITYEDVKYFEKIKKDIQMKSLENHFEFIGNIPNKNISRYYTETDILINISDTGSMDKVVLEAMASNTPTLTSNEAYKNVIPDEYFSDKDPDDIALKIIALKEKTHNPLLRNYVAAHHSLQNLIKNIMISYE